MGSKSFTLLLVVVQVAGMLLVLFDVFSRGVSGAGFTPLFVVVALALSLMYSAVQLKRLKKG